jgi:Na+/H+ antiporter NhaD/arsenite permease-like protein
MSITNAPTSTLSPTTYQYLIPVSELPWGAWYTLALIVIAAFILSKNWIPTDLVFLGIDAMLILAQIITVNEGISGFGQSGVLTVGILMVAIQGVIQTGGLGHYASKILGSPRNTGDALVRALCLGGLISSFVNDTSTFLLLLPILQSWTKKLGLDIRTVLLPMSFTVLLGGTNTLIGTSTNLAISGEFYKAYPLIPLELFGITRVGIPVLFWGLAYMFLFSEVLLVMTNKVI